MELNLKDVTNLWHELNGYAVTKDGKKEVLTKGFLQQKMSMKVKLYVNRLAKIVNEEVETLDKSRQEVYDKYAKSDRGEKKEITGDDVKLFYDDIEELMSAKKNIDVTTLWSSDLTINDLASIETEENYPIFYRLVDNKE
jgi:hypothetical protein